jgi:lysophospholipase L1-like esterase
LAALWKSIGCKVIVADVIARVDFSAPQRAAATQFNAELAADHSFADGYVCASTTFPDFTDESKFFTDHLHLNTNGYALRAALEAPEVLRLVSTFPAA